MYRTDWERYEIEWARENSWQEYQRQLAAGTYDPVPRETLRHTVDVYVYDALQEALGRASARARADLHMRYAADLDEYAAAWAYESTKDPVPTSAITPDMVERKRRAIERMRVISAERLREEHEARQKADAALRKLALAAEAYVLARLRGRGKYVVLVRGKRAA